MIQYCDSNGPQLHNRKRYALCTAAALATLDLKQATEGACLLGLLSSARPSSARQSFVLVFFSWRAC